MSELKKHERNAIMQMCDDGKSAEQISVQLGLELEVVESFVNNFKDRVSRAKLYGRIKELFFSAGLSKQQIADQLGIKIPVVTAALRTGPDTSEEAKKRLCRAMKAQGCEIKEIASTLGILPSKVVYFLENTNTYETTGGNPGFWYGPNLLPQVKNIMQMYDSGVSYGQLALEYGCSEAQIKSFIKRQLSRERTDEE